VKLNFDVWERHETVARQLLWWSALSVAAGLALFLPDKPFLRGFGLQALVWGAIDAAIAWIGRLKTRQRHAVLSDPADRDIVAGETRKLRRLLLINAGLDVLYVAGGLLWTQRAESEFGRGNAWGVVLQGAFLFGFDLVHGLRLKAQPPAR
jgi:hypothetical protein